MQIQCKKMWLLLLMTADFVAIKVILVLLTRKMQAFSGLEGFHKNIEGMVGGSEAHLEL